MSSTEATEFDTIIVGTGPGGGTVARELSLRRQRVLVLEAGSDSPVGDSVRSQAAAMRLDFMGRGIPIAKGVTLGGTSMLYYGCAFPPPRDLFARHGIDLSREVEEIRKELPVGPLPDSAVGPRAQRIRSSARALGYDWQKLDKFVFAERCERGMPHAAKWNARLFVEEAVRNGATLKTRARARRVSIENGRAVGVEFEENGEARTARGHRVVVSAGGIGSSVLLRASGIRGAGEGFFCDPLVIVNGSVREKFESEEPPMATGIHLPEDGYMLTDLAHPSLVYRALAARALRFDRLFAHRHTLSIMVKVRDDVDGRITERGRVRRRLTSGDLGKLRHGYARAKEILENAGARGVFGHHYVAAHPGGSVRVGDVVDSNLKTEHENLYVCDCSVIPEPWGLPPTFTLIALAKRLSRHLTGEA